MTESDEVRSLVIELVTPEGQSDPYPFYERLRNFGPVAQAGRDAFVVTSYEECDRVFRSRDFGVQAAAWRDSHQGEWRLHRSRIAFAESMMLLDGEQHQRLRRLYSGTLNPGQVNTLRPMITQTADELLDRLETEIASNEIADLVTLYAEALPVAVISDLLGIPLVDRLELQRLSLLLSSVLELFANEAQLAAADDAADRLREYVVNLIRARANKLGDDLLSHLITRHRESGGVSPELDLWPSVVQLFAAGFTTTSAVISSGVQLLAAHPSQAKLVRERPEIVFNSVNEIMRYDSPVHVTTRVAKKNLMLGKALVTQDAVVYLLVGAAHRDPLRYASPNVLDFERPAPDPLSFAAGSHACLGAALARTEVAVALTRLGARIPDLKIATKGVRRPGIAIRMWDRVEVQSAELSASSRSRRAMSVGAK